MQAEDLLFGDGDEFVGQLGLFPYQQRIIKTLQQGHVDYYPAIWHLLDSVHAYKEEHYNTVLQCLETEA